MTDIGRVWLAAARREIARLELATGARKLLSTAEAIAMMAAGRVETGAAYLRATAGLDRGAFRLHLAADRAEAWGLPAAALAYRRAARRR